MMLSTFNSHYSPMVMKTYHIKQLVRQRKSPTTNIEAPNTVILGILGWADDPAKNIRISAMAFLDKFGRSKAFVRVYIGVKKICPSQDHDTRPHDWNAQNLTTSSLSPSLSLRDPET